MVWPVMMMAMAWQRWRTIPRWRRPRHPRCRTFNVARCVSPSTSMESMPPRPSTPPPPLTWPPTTVLWKGGGRRWCHGRSQQSRSLHVLLLWRKSHCVNGELLPAEEVVASNMNWMKWSFVQQRTRRNTTSSRQIDCQVRKMRST